MSLPPPAANGISATIAVKRQPAVRPKETLLIPRPPFPEAKLEPADLLLGRPAGRYEGHPTGFRTDAAGSYVSPLPANTSHVVRSRADQLDRMVRAPARAVGDLLPA